MAAKSEEKKEDQKKDNIISRIRKHPLFVEIALILVILITVVAVIVYNTNQSRVYIENSQIYAPTITLSPQSPGVLQKINVQAGDVVGKHKEVAIVNDIPIVTETGGVILSTNNLIGQVVNSQTPIVTMMNPEDLRLIGKIDENKGLRYIKEGQKVVFTIDAFGSKKYDAYVESVALIAVQSDIVFSISDQRQERQFEVKVKFDINAYPELKNGMSAKMWVYK